MYLCRYTHLSPKTLHPNPKASEEWWKKSIALSQSARCGRVPELRMRGKRLRGLPQVYMYLCRYVPKYVCNCADACISPKPFNPKLQTRGVAKGGEGRAWPRASLQSAGGSPAAAGTACKGDESQGFVGAACEGEPLQILLPIYVCACANIYIYPPTLYTLHSRLAKSGGRSAWPRASLPGAGGYPVAAGTA